MKKINSTPVAYDVTACYEDLTREEKKQEAAHEAAGREMRAAINRHSEERVAEIDAEYARQQRATARIKAMLKKDALYLKQYTAFRARNFVSLTVAALFALGGICGTIVPVLSVVGALVACEYCALNCVAYASRNNRKGE